MRRSTRAGKKHSEGGWVDGVIQGDGIDAAAGDSLAARGHDLEWLPVRSDAVAGVCAISANLETSLIAGGADPRRSGRAMGW